MQVTWSDSTSKGKEANHSNESEDNPIFWMHKYEITLILFYVFFFYVFFSLDTVGRISKL